jgi:Fe-S-cluster containining protein
MDSEKHACQKCRGCCKFEEDELYFAPLFTKAEVEKIKAKVSCNASSAKKAKPSLNAAFHLYKNSDKVFQVELIKSEDDPKLWVCPFLDEKTHLCSIYSERNLDCRLWPFIFMNSKKGEVVLAHFDRDMCPIWNEMKEEDFLKVKQRMVLMLEEEEIVQTLREHPELAWEYEQYTTVISTHRIGKASVAAVQTF